MLKSLNKNDTLNTPFSAVKEWHLSNVLNSDLILYEHAAPGGGDLAVAVEFLDYGDGSGKPFFNASCSLAKEDQSLDKIEYREGKKISGIFYPDKDPINLDLTYKRVVYNQVQNMFYNNYRDPTKMWGMEQIDFDKSQTKKFLQDKFVLFDVPTNIMGEKVIPNSVTFIDDSSDNEYIISDDGNCNLLIGRNVFSKQQELRSFSNLFESGSDGTCDNYFNFNVPLGFMCITASQVDASEIVQLDWFYSENDAAGYIIERSVDSGSTYFPLLSAAVGVSQSFDSTVLYGNIYWYRAFAYNLYGTSSYRNTASVYISSVGPPIGIPSITASVLPYAPHFLSVVSGSAILNWLSSSNNQDYFSIQRSVNVSSNFVNLATTPANVLTYTDTSVTLGNIYWYRVAANNIAGTSSFSNIVFISFLSSSNALEPWDEYQINQSSSFNSGSGKWVGEWNLNSLNRLVSTEPFEEYTLGQTGGFNSGSGWATEWITASVPIYLAASESFEEYTIGQTNGFNGGTGWSGSWTDFSGSI